MSHKVYRVWDKEQAVITDYVTASDVVERAYDFPRFLLMSRVGKDAHGRIIFVGDLVSPVDSQERQPLHVRSDGLLELAPGEEPTSFELASCEWIGLSKAYLDAPLAR